MGSLFHNCGAATEKAQSPSHFCVLGTTRFMPWPERVVTEPRRGLLTTRQSCMYWGRVHSVTFFSVWCCHGVTTQVFYSENIRYKYHMQSWIWIWYALITSCSDYYTDDVWDPSLLRAVIGQSRCNRSLDPAKFGRKKKRQKVNKAQQEQPEHSHHRLPKSGEPQYEWKMKKYSHAGIKMQINASWSCTQTWTWHHTQGFINN